MMNSIVSAIETVASPSEESLTELKKQSSEYKDVSSWINWNKTKVAGTGALGGIIPGPWGAATEVADIAYLLRIAARTSWGVGYIKKRRVDPHNDLLNILAVWADVAEVQDEDLLESAAYAAGSKILLKVGTKGHIKIAAKLAAKGTKKAAAKILAKVSGKVASKWIPFVGAVVSAGINVWLLDGITDAANRYYAVSDAKRTLLFTNEDE